MPGVGLIRSKLRPSRWLSPKSKQSSTKRRLLITASSKSFSARCANSVSKSSSDRHRESANAPAAYIPKVPYLSAIPGRAFAAFTELEHGQPISDQDYQQAWEDVQTALRNFYKQTE